jgi:hypothetical protein
MWLLNEITHSQEQNPFRPALLDVSHSSYMITLSPIDLGIHLQHKKASDQRERRLAGRGDACHWINLRHKKSPRPARESS